MKNCAFFDTKIVSLRFFSGLNSISTTLQDLSSYASLLSQVCISIVFDASFSFVPNYGYDYIIGHSSFLQFRNCCFLYAVIGKVFAGGI